MRCYLVSIKEKQKAKLKDVLAEEDTENESLQKTLLARCKQLSKLQAKCDERTQQLSLVSLCIINNTSVVGNLVNIFSKF